MANNVMFMVDYSWWKSVTLNRRRRGRRRYSAHREWRAIAGKPASLPVHAVPPPVVATAAGFRSEEHTSELQSLMRISYAVFCLKKNKKKEYHDKIQHQT